ncbi:MAG: hypothetical protein GEV28_00215 [Actinophytocola sp.]|uniref:hypothetical protein n=1 Tax=Actinophytocola sp. TaxID=1872138 RepID=UPI00132116C2|nr:hypothetical protein [Actinophytocola sp.]MPZ78895.1 hypothetical protein [Actinophytocola sp.]
MSTITPVPQSVRNATLAVWAVLALLVLRAILTVVFSDELVDAYVDGNETLKSLPREFAVDGAPRYTAVAIGVLVIGAVFAFAAANLGKAARWARVVAIVFASLSLLGVVVSVIAPTIPVLLVINVVVGLLSAAVIVLLCTGDANRFFAK